MPYNFYWRNEAEIVSGAVAFASLISSSPESYGISPAQAASFSALSVALKGAHTTANDPSTRTPVAVQAKNGALKAMRANAIFLANIVYANPMVDDSQLAGLCLNPRPRRTRIEAPGESPRIEIIEVRQRMVSLRVRPRDSMRLGKAFGAAGANLYSFIGENPPSDPRDYHFEKLTTRAKTQITFPDSVPSGATVWLSACWVSARGETSPGSSPLNVTIQGGSLLPKVGMVA